MLAVRWFRRSISRRFRRVLDLCALPSGQLMWACLISSCWPWLHLLSGIRPDAVGGEAVVANALLAGLLKRHSQRSRTHLSTVLFRSPWALARCPMEGRRCAGSNM